MKKFKLLNIIEGFAFAVVGILLVMYTNEPLMAFIYSVPLLSIYFIIKHGVLNKKY